MSEIPGPQTPRALVRYIKDCPCSLTPDGNFHASYPIYHNEPIETEDGPIGWELIVREVPVCRRCGVPYRMYGPTK